MTTWNTGEHVLRRRLTREAGPVGDAQAVAAAARRLCEQLARQVAPLIGDGGIAAICARSRHLTHFILGGASRGEPGVIAFFEKRPSCAGRRKSSWR